MELSSPPPFQLGAWRVQPSLNRISRNGETARVTPKVMQVLCCLAEHCGEVVPREHLMDTVWPDVVVNEDVLTRAISDLRKVFEDDPQAPEVIETIPKNGYRLIAPIRFDYPGDSVPDAVPSFDVRVPAPQAAATPPSLQRGLRLGEILLGVALLSGFAWWFWSDSPASSTSLQPVPLTSLPGVERDAVLSPDGRQVAFAWQGTSGDNWDLYLLLPGDAAPLRLTDDPATDVSPTWSPDGQRLAFFRYTDDGCTIYEVSALGNSVRRLASCGANITSDLAWSPDGRWLAFADKPSPEASFSIFLLDPETGERRQLTAPGSQHWGDSAPSFSPDGHRLAFTRGVSMATQDIFVVPVEGGTPQRVTPEPSAIRGHTWNPDGQHLTFASSRGGSINLWEIPVDGGSPTWIAAAGLNAYWPNRAGSRLVYEQQTEETNVAHLTLDGSVEPTPWIASTRADLHPAYAPNGERVAFVSDRSGSFELWVSRSDGSKAVRLTSFGGPFVGSPVWSPDGTQIAFDARPDSHADVFVLDAEGGPAQRITLEPSNDLAPAWSPDGNELYFGSNRTGTWQIWKQPTAGGEAVQITTEGGYAAMPSPDDTQIYFTKYDRTGLWSQPLSGGPAEAVLEDTGPSFRHNWTVRSDGLFYLDADTLVRYDLATRTATSIWPAPDALASAGFALDADSRSLLYIQAGRQNTDLMLLDVGNGE